MDDPRNTDDAWVVSEAHYIHDSSYFLSNYPLMDVTSSESLCTVTWYCDEAISECQYLFGSYI